MPVLLRNANIDDIARIMEILADGRSALAKIGIDQWQGYYPHEAIIREDICSMASYVVEDENGRLLGTAMIGFEGEEDYHHIEGAWLTDSPEAEPTYAVVHRIAVCNEARGQGVAGFILQEAESIAAAAGFLSIRVDTHPGNKPMMGLLNKRAYDECGIIYIDHAEESTPERIAYEKVIFS